jgi:hypothetical protein
VVARKNLRPSTEEPEETAALTQFIGVLASASCREARMRGADYETPRLRADVTTTFRLYYAQRADAVIFRDVSQHVCASKAWHLHQALIGDAGNHIRRKQ